MMRRSLILKHLHAMVSAISYTNIPITGTYAVWKAELTLAISTRTKSSHALAIDTEEYLYAMVAIIGDVQMPTWHIPDGQLNSPGPLPWLPIVLA
jgi:hypothetical protein